MQGNKLEGARSEATLAGPSEKGHAVTHQPISGPLLFLDFDGVLHPHEHYRQQHFSSLPRLETLLRDYPGVNVVVTSSWRESFDLCELRQFFSEEIAPRIIGVTPYIDDRKPFRRYREIQQFLAQHAGLQTPWLALDDMAFHYPQPCPQLIVCNLRTGFGDTEELRLRHLQGQIVQGADPHPNSASR